MITHTPPTAPRLLFVVALQLLGFPVQLIGLLALPYLGIRWYVDGQDAGKDLEEYAVSNFCVLIVHG